MRAACYDWRVELNDAVEAIVRDLDQRWGVDAVWLFGSQVRGSCADSDIDLAVLFRHRPDGPELLDARADLEALVGRPIDVVDLDAASPIIAHQTLKPSRLLTDHTPRRRIEFLTRLIDRCLSRIAEVRGGRGGALLPVDVEDITVLSLTRHRDDPPRGDPRVPAYMQNPGKKPPL